MKEYEILVNGVPHTVQYTDEEAARLGLTPVESKKQVPNKGRAAANKG